MYVATDEQSIPTITAVLTKVPQTHQQKKQNLKYTFHLSEKNSALLPNALRYNICFLLLFMYLFLSVNRVAFVQTITY
jgi:hypothetical protein